MRVIPVYNSLILPDTKFQFGKDDLDKLGIEAIEVNEELVFVFQKDTDDFYPIGVAGTVISVDEDNNITVQAKNRVTIADMDVDGDYIEGTDREMEENVPEDEMEKQLETLKKQLLDYTGKFQMGFWVRRFIKNIDSWEDMAVRLAPYMNMTCDERYEILKADTRSEQMDIITKDIQEFITIMQLTQEAKEENDESYQKRYREDALKKQIAFLQRELDNMHPENKSQVQLFEEKIEKSGMNATARKEVDKVLQRFRQEGQDSHEYGMLYDYLDFVTSLDWKKRRVRNINLAKAEDILDKEHYGLKKVKKRIIEQMAVMSLSRKQTGSILLFVGAPGTGKTSIAHSIAHALGRKYVRISLGGVKDEAEIRGHRRTYVGAMPGRIMDGIQKAGVSNPVMVLDEIDKLSMSYNGDPASALLEVLDPEQNNTFTDHYLNAPYDLSDVMFICTANSLEDIPGPLLDRMEVIQFTGYTPLEKIQIGKVHLLDKSKSKNGISEDALSMSDEAMQKLITEYTMEAGVRGLKKQLDNLCRFAAVELVKGNSERIAITEENLADFIDTQPIHHDKVIETKEPGIVTGLAWTAVGGEILFIESLFTKGSGKVQITGQLGDVMKESVQIAISLVKKMYPEQAEIFEQNDLHVHVPAGATPKDGPSAGITLTTALASLVTGKAVSPEYAMTGEVSLRGHVMPIGGLPEKLMAADRAGVKKVFIPKDNEFDLKDVAPEVKEHLTIIPVEKITDVLNTVFA